MTPSGGPGIPRRLVLAAGGSVFVGLAVTGMLRGRILVSVPAMLFGCFTFFGAFYNRPEPSGPLDPALDRRKLATMALIWLGVGVLTLVMGLASGGVLLALCIVGFLLSMYLCVAFSGPSR